MRALAISFVTNSFSDDIIGTTKADVGMGAFLIGLTTGLVLMTSGGQSSLGLCGAHT